MSAGLKLKQFYSKGEIMKKLNNERGMTLIEILIVLSIIGAIAYTLFGDVFLQADNAKIKITKGQIADLKKKIQIYKMDQAKYPESWDELVNNKVIESVPVDSWGQELLLEVPGTHGGKFDIWSIGPDEKPDTEDDVVSWTKDSEQ